MRGFGRVTVLRRRGRAFLATEAVISIVAALVLLTAISITISRQARAEKQMAASRAGARVLETSMLALQTGGRVAGDVRVERLERAAPAGYVWVRIVQNESPGRPLVGLVAGGQLSAGVATAPAGNEGGSR